MESIFFYFFAEYTSNQKIQLEEDELQTEMSYGNGKRRRPK